MSNLSWTPCLYYTTDSLLLSVHKEKNSLKRSKYISQSALLLLYIYQVLQELLSISKTQPKKNTERERELHFDVALLIFGDLFLATKGKS